MLLEKFSLRDFQAAERSLLTLAKPAKPEERITRDLLRKKTAITLGDFILSDDHPLYTTDHQVVFARANLPYTDGVAWFEAESGLAHQLGWTVNLGRLRGIKQLALLGPPVCQNRRQTTLTFNHDRFLHTYDVYALGMICAHNMGVKGKDLVALRLSLLVHDLFTPACGDLMKFIDKKAYDEDALLAKLLSDDRWIHLCGELGVNPAEPIRIAQKKDGVLCSIRDLADTLAYVARDLHAFHGQYPGDWKEWYENEEDRLLEDELRSVSANPEAFTLWESVRPGKDGSIVVNNHEKLYQFLFARACLFRLLYYHRQTRHIEYVLGIRIVKTLIEKGVFSEDDFFGERSSDERIWHKVNEETGYLCYGLHHGDRGKTWHFDTLAKARAHVGRVCERFEGACGLIYTWPSTPKTKVGMWRVEKGGREMPWNEAYPEKAQRIEEIMRLPAGYYGSIAWRKRLPHINDKYWKILCEKSSSVV
jgi:hypothetical protein